MAIVEESENQKRKQVQVQLETIQVAYLPSSTSLHVALFKDVSNPAALYAALLAGNPAYEYAFIDATMVISRLHILSGCFRALNDLLHSRLRTRNVHSEIVLSLAPSNNISSAFRTFGVSPGEDSAPKAEAPGAGPKEGERAAVGSSENSADISTVSENGDTQKIEVKAKVADKERTKVDAASETRVTRHVIAIKVSTAEKPVAAEEVATHLAEIIDAQTSVQLTDDELTALTDFERVRKVYKIGTTATATANSGGARRGNKLSVPKKRKGEEEEEEEEEEESSQRQGSHKTHQEKHGQGGVGREIEAVAIGMMALRGS